LSRRTNDVHGAADSDDSELTDVHYGSEEDAKYLQQGGGYGGSYNCGLCPNDDDALKTVSTTASHKAWEVSFVKTLMDSSFAKLSSCSIKMSPHASYQYEEDAPELATTAAEVEENFSATKLIIEPHCSGVNFGSLSVSDNALAGHILEDAFNKIHSGSDSDDKELSDVKWGSYGDFGDEASSALQQGGGYGGSYGCGLCPNDDDAILGLSGNGMNAWQTEFVAGLAATGKKSFEKVTDCSIKPILRGRGTER